mmetsp:Transcript_17378/g.29773  ORF Transcript_17378/g.29773 Transcript_17378/m.29773 type:complete len:336 (+) Transcript_17378:26-1033(+)
MADKVLEAAKLVKKANKFLSPSLFDFRLKPDWEAAAPLLDRAAVLFRQSGTAHVQQALETYEQAANAQNRILSPWHAAKHMESAAELCKQQKMWEKVAEYYKNAAEYYITAGKFTTGADCLMRGARSIDEVDVEQAMTMLFDAIDIYENDTQTSNGQDVFRQATSTAVKAQRWHEAVDVQMRYASYCDRTGARSSQCKCYLGAIVTHLYAKEAKAAWMLFQDALAIDVFVSSEEAFTADALFSAYKSGDEELVRQVVKKKSIFKELDNQVARLAVKLPPGRIEKMARRLRKVMGTSEYEEEDEQLYEGEAADQEAEDVAQRNGPQSHHEKQDELL